jgi:hypothetical protein
MSYFPKSPIGCAAATLSIASHIRSNKLPTTSGTTFSPRLKMPATSQRTYKGRRVAKLYESGGQNKTIYQWINLTGLPYSTIQQRIQRGAPLDAPKSRAGRPASVK